MMWKDERQIFWKEDLPNILVYLKIESEAVKLRIVILLEICYNMDRIRYHL